MRRNVKKILISVLAAMVLGLPTVQAEEADTLLRWKNGGSLPGQLQESSPGTIRWASPYFLDDLVLDINVLNSVVFPKTSNPATETFRVSTVSDDVWIADLIGSDEDTFLFSSKRHGHFRVKRAAVRSLEHRNHSNLLFDGSQLTQPTAEPTAQQVDLSKPRVYMMNGQIFQGKLFVQKDSVYVLDTDGTRHDIDLQKVSRVVQPELPSTALDVGETGLPSSYIKYPDEVVLRGKVTQVNANSVMLQTTFADEPVTCSLAGASRLHFDINRKTDGTVQRTDMLFHTRGNLRGRVLFTENRGILSIQWEPLGALKPVRLASNRAAHIRRFLQPTSKVSRHFDTTEFPHALHLQTGETFPCQITDYDGKTISFQSPFISTQHLDSATTKALEFSDRTHAPSIDRTHPATASADRENGIIEIDMQRFGQNKDGIIEIEMHRVGQDKDGKAIVFRINADDAKKMNEGQLVRTRKIKERNPGREWMEMEDDTWIGLIATQPAPKKDKSSSKLERALTVPRFNRDHPPNHILVAKTGDMKRGKFLDFQGQTIQFDSKLRKVSVPIDRVARVVDVSGDGFRQSAATQTEVRVTLTDGSMLIFAPLEVQEDRMIGHSSVYGEVSVPVSSIEYLYFGEKARSFKAAFEKWNIRPAKKPAYGDNP